MLMALALLGCVPKGKFVELENQLAAAQQEHAAALADRDATLGALRGELAGLETESRRLADALGSKERALAKLQEKHATLLEAKGDLAAEMEDMRTALAELERRKAAADARLGEFRDLIERFRSLIDAGTLEVKIKDGRMLVAMATDVLFSSGSATLSKEGKAALSEVARILASIPDRTFQVEGHTDDDPIATAQFPSNWFLASRRAINVVDHMLDTGMPAERISAASFGEFRPVVANDSKENKALNRRIEIVVVPDLSQLPGYAELQALQ